jgi:hypothetical protein
MSNAGQGISCPASFEESLKEMSGVAVEICDRLHAPAGGIAVPALRGWAIRAACRALRYSVQMRSMLLSTSTLAPPCPFRNVAAFGVSEEGQCDGCLNVVDTDGGVRLAYISLCVNYFYSQAGEDAGFMLFA